MTGVRVRRQAGREAWALGALASAAAALLVWLGPPGTDFAAHAYQEGLFAAHGFALWNNLWYAGRYSFVTYSTLYYPLAALVGIRVLAVVCAGVAVTGFAVVVRHRWGPPARWASRSIAVVVPAFVLTGAFPFLLGVALSALALVARQSRRWWAFVPLCVLVAAASPLAFVLLGILALAMTMGEGPERRPLLMTLAALAAVGGLLALSAAVFPSAARYPFPVRAFVPAVAFAGVLVAVTWGVEDARGLRSLGLLYLVACVAVFVVASEVGEGITRLRYFALPLMLLALALRHWRPRRVAVLAGLLACYWNAAPLVSSFAHGSADPSVHAAYWRPATTFLRREDSPAYRVEVVDTQTHWAAAYLPDAGIPLVRGWFRQDDFPQNEVLYGQLTPRRYRHWLRSLAVRYVVLTDAVPDYSARREAALLRSGRSGLRVVLRTPHLWIYRVPAPRAIASGPGRPRVLAFARDRLTLRLAAPGTYRVAVRFSPYWTSSAGCLTRGSDGMLRLAVGAPATVRLHFSVRLASMVDVIAGDGTRPC